MALKCSSPPPTWHHPTDVEARKLMLVLLRRHPALIDHQPLLLTRATSSPTLLQRLEWLLYHSAGSLREYLYPPSLERRVQGLVTHSKRKRTPRNQQPMAKRPKLQLTTTETDQFQVSSHLEATDCFWNCNVDLLRHVCGFLDGLDVLHCRGINKLLYVHAPTFVRALQIDVSSSIGQREDVPRRLRTILFECKHITCLTIANQANQTHVKAGVAFPRALNLSRLATTTSTSSGYDSVREITYAVKKGACPLLETLELVAPFDCAAESDAVVELLSAFASEDVVRSPLLHLRLDATFLGDRGVQQLGNLFKTQSRFFKHLKTLSVRNNFMGETGCRALLQVMVPFRDLHTLDLSCNILTDTDALALADVLDEECECPEVRTVGLAGLRTLKLGENFITCDGFHAISIALCSRQSFVAMSRK